MAASPAAAVKRISWGPSDESGPTPCQAAAATAVTAPNHDKHDSVPALGLAHDGVTRELGLMAERIVALETERDQLQEGARWRGQVKG